MFWNINLMLTWVFHNSYSSVAEDSDFALWEKFRTVLNLNNYQVSTTEVAKTQVLELFVDHNAFSSKFLVQLLQALESVTFSRRFPIVKSSTIVETFLLTSSSNEFYA